MRVMRVLVMVGLVGVGSAFAQVGTRPAGAPATAPRVGPVVKGVVPGAKAVEEASKGVDEKFSDQIAAAKTPGRRAAVAWKLLQAAAEETDAAARYALLMTVRELGTEGSDLQTAALGIDAIDHYFIIDRWKELMGAAAAISKTMSVPEQRYAMVVTTRRLAEQAMGMDRYDLGRMLAELGVGAAKAATDPMLLKDAEAMLQAVKEMEVAYWEARGGAEVLAKFPEDAAANLKVGRFKCFLKGDWKAGLPLLVKGSDKGLAELAKRDLAGAAAVEERLKIGDGWWELAEGAAGLAKLQMQRRACVFYGAAAPGLSGLMKARTEKRMREVPLLGMSMVKLDESNYLAEILQKLPKEMLPLESDTAEELRKKSDAARRWAFGDGPRGGGHRVTVLTRFQGGSVSESQQPAGKGNPTHHMFVSFMHTGEFNGMPVQVSVQINRQLKSADDPLAREALEMQKAGKDLPYLVEVPVMYVAFNYYRPKVPDASGQLVEGPVTIRAGMSVMGGEFLVKEVER
jgi:hypothetical protein